VTKPRGPHRFSPESGGPAAGRDREDEPFVRLTALARGRVEAHGASDAQRAGALLRRAALPDGLDAERLERVWERLGPRRPSRAVNRPVVRLRWAVGAVLLLSAGAMAATGAWRWPATAVRRLIAPAGPTAKVLTMTGMAAGAPRRDPAAASTPANVAPAQPPQPAAPTAGEPPPSLPATAPSSLDPTALGAHRRPGPPRALRSPAQPVPAPRDSQLAEESGFVGRALVRLRQARDSDGALAELERYAQRFPSGILEHEALAVRVDALLLAGRAAEAQAILSRLTLGSTARDRELRLIRAELATGSDCTAALNDYQAVWKAQPAGTWGERALWGQAVCAARLGNEAGARGHLTRYLARFPDGPHAEEARTRLRQ